METGLTSGIVAERDQVADAEYRAFVERINQRFLSNTATGTLPVFKVSLADDGEAFGVFLTGLPEEQRQFHNCSCCRNFFRTYGTLAQIAADGSIVPAFWDPTDAPPLYELALRRLDREIRAGKIARVFKSSDAAWGQRKTGPWEHFALSPPVGMLHKRGRLTAGQAAAEKSEDFKTVMHALNEFTQPMIESALTLLRAEALYRSEKLLGQAEWLHALHVARAGAQGNRKANVVWRAIATAPAGFCHPRSSMIGSLLEDIAAGLEFSDVKAKFAAKMHPLRYQRPQAAPSAGNIAAAEKLFETLGLAASLPRRFARLEELQTIWLPAQPKAEAAGGGVFGHLKPKGEEPMAQTIQTGLAITWEKFKRTVLPTAKRMELLVPLTTTGNFGAYLTAVNGAAPPIIQWDSTDQRNPVSWYLYHGGSAASQWGLAPGNWIPVTGISLQPSSWFDVGAFSHQGEGALFVLEGARDSRRDGACLFPEILKSDLHAVRATIEAYSREAEREGYEDASACGWLIEKSSKPNTRVRVTNDLGTQIDYAIDRWD